MNIGANIKKIRKEQGLTQKELGERLNMSQSAIGQFENNKSTFKVETLEKIANALNVEPKTLLENCSTFSNPYLIESYKELYAFDDYIASLGYDISVESHSDYDLYVKENGGVEDNYSPDPDKDMVIWEKDSQTAFFVETEMNKLRKDLEEYVEFLFYKKLKQQKTEK